MRRDWGLLLRQWKTHVAPDMPIETWAEFEQWNESRDQFWRAVEVIARQEVEMFQAEHEEG